MNSYDNDESRYHDHPEDAPQHPFGFGKPSFNNGQSPRQDSDRQGSDWQDSNLRNPNWQNEDSGRSSRQFAGVNAGPGFVGSVKLFFSQYATFRGRSRRSEYWYAVLFYYLTNVVLRMLGLSGLTSLFSLVTIVPFLALQCRRLHDIGRTGRWMWLLPITVCACFILVAYSIIYALTYISDMYDMLLANGIKPEDYYFLYPLLNLTGTNVIGILAIIMLATSILFLVFNLIDSDKGTNKYGPSQKYPDGNFEV